MAIRNLFSKLYRDFSAGRFTAMSVIDPVQAAALITRNVVLFGDGIVRKRNGYSLVVRQVALVLQGIFYFLRQADQKAMVLNKFNQYLVMDNVDGTGGLTLTTGLNANTIPTWATNSFEWFMHDSNIALVGYNNGSSEVIFAHGLATRLTAPTLAFPAGALTLKYGRQYVVCDVVKWTDNAGVARLHIGAPSPISAHTGQQTAKTPTLSAMTATGNRVTHKWIFATLDSPANSTSTFFFAAEITDATTSWGDTLSDAQLDTTRQAPWDNLPPPIGGFVFEYNNRLVVLKGNRAYVSAYEETDLGIKQESFPAWLFFEVPGGDKNLTAGLTFDSMCLLSTTDFWFGFSGTNASNFKKQDRIMSPGCVGKRAFCVTPSHIVWLADDKQLYAWNGGDSAPVKLSTAIQFGQTGFNAAIQPSMSDIVDSELSNASVVYYSNGKSHFILVAACITGGTAGTYNWIGMYDVSKIAAAAATQNALSSPLPAPSICDMFPSHAITSLCVVKPYVYMGDVNGFKYKWPDAAVFKDAGVSVPNQFGHVWQDGDDPELQKTWKNIDIFTNRQDAKTAFAVSVVASDSANMSKALTNLTLQDYPNPSASDPVDPTAARALINRTGKYLRAVVTFPFDDTDAQLYGYSVEGRALNKR